MKKLLFFVLFLSSLSWSQGISYPASAPIYSGAGYITLPNFQTSSIFFSNIGTGDIDLYTVPTGKRAMFEAFLWDSTASAITAYSEVKIGATYYPVQQGVPFTNTTSAATNPVWPIMLEAGQKFSVNTTGTGLNVVGAVYTFGSTANLKSSVQTTFISGNNTIYACCSAGKTTAYLVTRVGGGLVNNGATGGNVYVSNNTAGTLSYAFNFVPNGGSASTANQITPSTSLAATAGVPKVASLAMGASFATGDLICVSSTSTNAAQIAWINIVEQP